MKGMNLWKALFLVMACVFILPSGAAAQVSVSVGGEDFDSDGIPDLEDNCKSLYNPEQLDSDGNGIGDDCDSHYGDDIDADGVPDVADNCPDIFNDQANNDGDEAGDECDSDDDNDTIADAADNCPILANTDQADDDRDGLGNACDASFDAGNLVDAIEAECSQAISLLRDLNPPGVNGLIAKCSGPGGVPKKVADAVTAFLRGVIDSPTYVARLDAALGELSAFDAQLDAKIANGQIPADQGAQLQALSDSIRQWIDVLKAAA